MTRAFLLPVLLLLLGSVPWLYLCGAFSAVLRFFSDLFLF